MTWNYDAVLVIGFGGPEKRDEAKDIFVDAMLELCEYNRSLGDIKLHMKIFDRDIDKAFLIGHFQDAAEVAERISKHYPDFGVLADLSHFPLLDEDPAEAIPLALFSFNVGIELGQLLFVVVALAALAVLRRLRFTQLDRSAPVMRLAYALPAYAIGTLGSFWLIERLHGLL